MSQTPIPRNAPQSLENAGAIAGTAEPAPPHGHGHAHGRHRLLIVLYLLVVFFYWVSQNIYLPTLPNFVQGKLGNLALVGTVLSMYSLWQALIRLPLGIVSDWLGRRKPFILVCMALSGLGAWGRRSNFPAPPVWARRARWSGWGPGPGFRWSWPSPGFSRHGKPCAPWP